MQLCQDTQKILSKKFKLKRLLGKGSFGNVYQCQQKKNGQVFAIKLISKTNVKKSTIQCMKQEATLLLSLEHPNIVKVYEFFQDEKIMYIKMQYVKCGTLGQLMKERQKQKIVFSDSQSSQIMGSVFRAVNYIHNLSILHRDIKPQNILLPDKTNFEQLKIADFGLGAKLQFRSPTAISKCGTYLFMAPQILWNYTYTKAVDIWSCAIIMYMLKKGNHPFYEQKMKNQDFKQKIKNIKFPPLEEQNPQDDEKKNNYLKQDEASRIKKKQLSLAQDLLNRISKIAPNQRYAAQDAIKHPWITRNLEDQIPLSLHDSFVGFQISHQFSFIAKTFLALKGMFYKDMSFEKFDKKQIFDRFSRHCQEVNKKDRSVSPLKIRRLSSLNTNRTSTRQIKELCELSQLSISPKKIKPPPKLVTESNDRDNPTIMKLNLIFGNLFNKKEKKDTYTEQFLQNLQDKPLNNYYCKEVPDISEYKQKIEWEIQKAIKQRNRRKKVRILPLRKKNDYGQIIGTACISRKQKKGQVFIDKHPFDIPIDMTSSLGTAQINATNKLKVRRRLNSSSNATKYIT